MASLDYELAGAARFIIVVVSLGADAACGGSVDARDDGSGGAASTSSSAAGCSLDGACGGAASNECCDGYACLSGTCQPHLSDDQCWNSNFDVACDPRFAPTGCSGGTSCIVDVETSIAVACTGPVPSGDPGAPCDAGSGCKPTLMCGQDDLCHKACCSDAECSPGQVCDQFYGQLGGLGTCRG
jgi:hypothetical protein